VRILKSGLAGSSGDRQLNLDKQPEGGNKTASLGLMTDGMQPDSAKTSAALSDFKSNLQVSLVPNTRSSKSVTTALTRILQPAW